MSIDRCCDCGALIDTDHYPETYREDFSNVPLCDECYEGRLIEDVPAGELPNPTRIISE